MLLFATTVSLLWITKVQSSPYLQYYLKLDMEPGGRGVWPFDGRDIQYGGTSCKICVAKMDQWIVPTNGIECKQGVPDHLEEAWLPRLLNIDIDGNSWEEGWAISTDCNDAMWIDRVTEMENIYGGIVLRNWGESDFNGWCLSTDPNDSWGGNPNHDACKPTLYFGYNGGWGYWDYNRLGRRSETAAGGDDLEGRLVKAEGAITDPEAMLQFISEHRLEATKPE